MARILLGIDLGGTTVAVCAYREGSLAPLWPAARRFATAELGGLDDLVAVLREAIGAAPAWGPRGSGGASCPPPDPQAPHIEPLSQRERGALAGETPAPLAGRPEGGRQSRAREQAGQCGPLESSKTRSLTVAAQFPPAPLLGAGVGSAIAGIGAAIAGAVDSVAGVVQHSPNVRWLRDAALGATLARAFGVPVAVDNDGNAFALAEATHGAGRGCRYVLGYTLGTGIGGGFTIDGRIHHGSGVGAGELGHVCIDPNGPECTCGQRGCLEAFIGGWAIPRLASALARGVPPATLAEVDIDATLIGERLCALAGAGDAFALRFWRHYGEHLARGVTPIVNVLRPEAIVFGGSGAASFAYFAAALREGLAARVFPPLFAELRIAPAEVPDAGCLGAALMARQRLAERL